MAARPSKRESQAKSVLQTKLSCSTDSQNRMPKSIVALVNRRKQFAVGGVLLAKASISRLESRNNLNNFNEKEMPNRVRGY